MNSEANERNSMKKIIDLSNQIQFIRDTVDPEMTALAFTLFCEVASSTEPVAITHLCNKFHLEASTYSRNLFYLSGGFVRTNAPRLGVGLLQTTTSPIDRRALLVSLTPKGEAIAKSLVKDC